MQLHRHHKHAPLYHRAQANRASMAGKTTPKTWNIELAFSVIEDLGVGAKYEGSDSRALCPAISSEVYVLELAWSRDFDTAGKGLVLFT